MGKKQPCKVGGATKDNGNCTEPGDDGLPVQCVGRWAEDKHDYLRRYIVATRAVRRRFLQPAPGKMAGGAAYIELFAGPGRARIRTTGVQVDGSPLIALRHAEAPFSKVILCDLDPENVAALTARTAGFNDRTEVILGDCNQQIDRIAESVPKYGLNFALIDPYGLNQHSFDTIAILAKFERMDLLIHFPTMDAKRNFLMGSPERLERAVGAPGLAATMHSPRDVIAAIQELRKQLGRMGYTGADVRSVEVKNSTGGVLYHLVYVSKHPKGDEIWESIARTTAGGQRGLF